MTGYTAAEVPSAPMEEAKLGEEEEEQGEVAVAADADETLPEMLDLLDTAEESGEDVEKLAAVIRDIGRRIRATPGDRDLLSDFEGITNICKALSESPHEWKGEAMLAFCKIMPDVCRTSNVNRGSLRDEGFLAAAVEVLRSAIVEEDDEAALDMAIATCMAISATCTANDGNKKVAAQLAESTPEKPGAMLLCLDVLGRFADNAVLQTEAMCALRTLMVDDDPRKAACEPAAFENREFALSDEGFPFLGIAVERALEVADKSEKPVLRMREQTLLLLREMARRQDFITALAFDAKLLPRVAATLGGDDPRVVRASMAVLRAFCAIEEVRDEIGMMSDTAYQCILAVYKHLATPTVCEQGFGIFQNLSMRKGPMAAKLNENEKGIVVLAQEVMRKHRARPDVMKSTVATIRNVASQDEAALQEVKESDIFDEVRRLVKEHEGEARWNSAVDISRQFLREFRMDTGMEKKAVYNQFY